MMQVVGKKTIEKMGKTINEQNGSQISSFARRQMEKMGWTEGKGLGKNEDGMAEHIRQKKKDDTAGLGVSQATEFVVDTSVKGSAKTSITGGNDNWWHDAFASNLKSLNKKKDKKKDKKKGKSKGAEEDEDEGVEEAPTFEALFKATGGVRLGMRARVDQAGKLRRGEKDVRVRGAEDCASNEAKEEEGGGREEKEGGGEEDEAERRSAKRERKRLRREKKEKEEEEEEVEEVEEQEPEDKEQQEKKKKKRSKRDKEAL